MTLSEIHISLYENLENLETLYDISGYNCISKHDVVGKGGGVAICVKNSKKNYRRLHLESSLLENIVIEVLLKMLKVF